MLKIDMHVHTWYSDSSGSVEEVIEAARRKGLDGIAITDHNTMVGVYEAIKKKGKLIVIPGEEVKTDRCEILALGIRSPIPKKLPIIEAIDKTHIQGGLVIIPHPTIPFFAKLKEKELKDLSIDGFEVLSAITPWTEYFLKKNLELARRMGLSITAGSDSHFPETVGDAYTVVYSKSKDLGDILYAIKSGNTTIGGFPSKLNFKLKMVRGIFTHIRRASFKSE